MCTYNGAAWVGQQLRTMAEQERRPDELVVCDDGSTDQTRGILRDFARQAPFAVRVIENVRQLGVARNFSQAIELCGGELIALADQDDLWGPAKLRVLEEALLGNPRLGLVFSDANLVNEDAKSLGVRLWQTLYLDPLQRHRLTDGQAMRVLTRTNVVTGAAMMFRGEHRGLILPISPHWVHDGWIALLISAVALIGMVEEPLMDYRQHPRQQIGARKTGLLHQVRIGLDMDSRYFELEAMRWRDAYERIVAHRGRLRFPDRDLQTLHEKAVFSRDRYLMRLNPDGRWDAIARHWQAGRYGEMAWGWKSLLQDIAIRR